MGPHYDVWLSVVNDVPNAASAPRHVLLTSVGYPICVRCAVVQLGRYCSLIRSCLAETCDANCCVSGKNRVKESKGTEPTAS